MQINFLNRKNILIPSVEKVYEIRKEFFQRSQTPTGKTELREVCKNKFSTKITNFSEETLQN